MSDDSETIARIKHFRDSGYSWPRIGKVLEMPYTQARGLIDPEWRKQAKKKAYEARKAREFDPAPHIRNVVSPTVRADIEARLAEIPPDTRDLTGTLLGDPLPGRSALAARGGYHTRS